MARHQLYNIINVSTWHARMSGRRYAYSDSNSYADRYNSNLTNS